MAQPKIFVSHSHSDGAFTARLVDDLRARGAEVWVDDAETRHANFPTDISDGLNATSAWLVLVLTPDAIAGESVNREVSAALDLVKQKRMRAVIPLLASPCPQGTIPPAWDALPRYDATGDYPRAFAKLCSALGLGLGLAESPPSPPALVVRARPRVKLPRTEPDERPNSLLETGSAAPISAAHGDGAVSGKSRALIWELGASVIVAVLIWAIGVLGLELVVLEGDVIHFSGVSRIYLLLAAPLFLGVMSYALVKWSHGYKGPSELIALLKQKSSEFPGWGRATTTWVIACIELGTGLSPKGFEGPYIAAGGGLSGLLATRLNLDSDARRRLARCGLGVAFGVLFHTPLGGFVCTFEFGGFERTEFKKQLPPAILATAVSIALTQTTEYWPKKYIISPPSGALGPYEIPKLLLIGLICGLVGLLYVFLIRTSKHTFTRLEAYAPLVLIPVMGATVSTMLGGVFPVILGSNELARALSQAPTDGLILVGAILAKTVATASADGSKCAGGTVGPAILLGGLIGILIGGRTNSIFAAAGSAAVIGPVAGLPLTMLMTSMTWTGFSPVAGLIVLPLAISLLVSGRMQLYPYRHPEPSEESSDTGELPRTSGLVEEVS